MIATLPRGRPARSGRGRRRVRLTESMLWCDEKPPAGVAEIGGTDNVGIHHPATR